MDAIVAEGLIHLLSETCLQGLAAYIQTSLTARGVAVLTTLHPQFMTELPEFSFKSETVNEAGIRFFEVPEDMNGEAGEARRENNPGDEKPEMRRIEVKVFRRPLRRYEHLLSTPGLAIEGSEICNGRYIMLVCRKT